MDPSQRKWIPLIGMFVLSLSCGLAGGEIGAPTPASTLVPGTSRRTLSRDGRQRSYVLHVPRGLASDEPIPVVLVFHGGMGNAENAAMMTGFDEQSEANGFVVVYPNGTGRFPNRLLTWNGGQCCGYAVEQGIDDVGFVEAILADLEQTVVVDQKRVYATGMSNGAILAYRLACELADRIAAIGPVAATQNIDDCKPEDQVSVIHFHGTEDRSVPYEGGIGPNSIAGVPFAPVKDSIEFWIDHNGCSSEPERQQFGSIRHERFSHCEGQAAVELYSVIGGGHAWPGGMPGREGAAVPTQEISASEIMWEFFEAHPKP